MLRLTHQVGRHQSRVRGVVGDHRHFRRPSENVDPHLTEKGALRLRDVLVAGADDDVRRLAGKEPIGQGRDGLDAAEGHDKIGTRYLHGVEHQGVDAIAPVRGGASDHGGDPCGLGGGDAHVGGGDVGVAPGGHVAACHVNGNQALAGRDPWMQLDGELANGIPLGQGEAPHLLGGEFDVALDLRRYVPGAAFHLLGADQDLAGPMVELPGVFAHRLLATPLDLGQHLTHDFLSGAGFRFRSLGCLFEVLDSHEEWGLYL
ncbi:MAG: hypothetical protein KatS3mg123_0237 [Burkholderiales bacterium]|nr:MAG: hypothetical protein KatS3mg123_0237 [Burkholderiales bacterium]